MKLRKGDNILVISGKDKGKVAKILKSLPKEAAVLVEGVNLKNKHVKPKRQGEKGQMVRVATPIDISNAKLICPKCQKATRVGYKVNKDRKYRVCKKCQSEI